MTNEIEREPFHRNLRNDVLVLAINSHSAVLASVWQWRGSRRIRLDFGSGDCERPFHSDMHITRILRDAVGNSVASDRSIALADGENLVFRFQEMLNEGWMPITETIHIKDCFVWHPEITLSVDGLVGVNYYTSVIGGDDYPQKVADQISSVVVPKSGAGESQIVPYVFKRPRNSKKTKLVDVHLVIDALRHAYLRLVDTIFILAGDGDFIPLIDELRRQGTKVVVAAFSSGLNPCIKSHVDNFFYTRRAADDKVNRVSG